MKAIITKYHGPTNFKGSRITATDEDGNRVTISYPHELSGEAVHWAAAQALCDKMNWTGKLSGGSLKNGYVFTFVDDFAYLAVVYQPACANVFVKDGATWTRLVQGSAVYCGGYADGYSRHSDIEYFKCGAGDAATMKWEPTISTREQATKDRLQAAMDGN
jgi:hypothetical protein